MFIPSLVFVFNSQSHYWDLGVEGGRLLSFSVFKNILSIIPIFILINYFKSDFLLKLFAVAGLTNSVLFMFDFGIYHNLGMDLMFNVLCFSLAIKYFPWYFSIVIFLGLTKVHTATSIVILSFQIFALTVYKTNFNFRKIGYGILLCAALLAYDLYYEFDVFFKDAGRFNIFEVLIGEWKNKFYFGYGAGTWEIWGPHFQIIKKLDLTYGYYTHAHNDWLQLLFEFGFIGMTVFMYFYLLALAKSFFSNVYIFISLMSFGLYMVFWFPLHLMLHTSLFILLVHSSICAKN
jgi:hypothetical protein